MFILCHIISCYFWRPSDV